MNDSFSALHAIHKCPQIVLLFVLKPINYDKLPVHI